MLEKHGLAKCNRGLLTMTTQAEQDPEPEINHGTGVVTDIADVSDKEDTLATPSDTFLLLLLLLLPPLLSLPVPPPPWVGVELGIDKGLSSRWTMLASTTQAPQDPGPEINCEVDGTFRQQCRGWIHRLDSSALCPTSQVVAENNNPFTYNNYPK
jgi:hypothetical protein